VIRLEDRLEEKRRALAGHARLAGALRAVVEEIRRTGALETALAVGEEFPDFLLPDAQGRLVSRAALLSRGPLVVAFLRGGWCPYCALVVAALAEAREEFAARGASVAVATPETGGLARDLLDIAPGAAEALTALADVDSGLAASCGILYRVPDAYLEVLGGFGVRIGERQGNAALVLPVPATFVVGRDGRVVCRHLDPDFTRRAEPADLIAALDATP